MLKLSENAFGRIAAKWMSQDTDKKPVVSGRRSSPETRWQIQTKPLDTVKADSIQALTSAGPSDTWVVSLHPRSWRQVGALGSTGVISPLPQLWGASSSHWRTLTLACVFCVMESTSASNLLPNPPASHVDASIKSIGSVSAHAVNSAARE